MEHVAVPGTFFDNEEIHLLTTASLDRMRSLNPQGSWDVRRFRPNFLIETDEGIEGLVEQSWIGKQLRIGSTVLTIAAATPRCGMPTRPQADLGYDSSVLRTIVREASQNFGVGAHCGQAGEIREGDVVDLS
ncbi:MAG: MOSC domain-containing protein [Bryobacterales bacterium]